MSPGERELFRLIFFSMILIVLLAITALTRLSPRAAGYWALICVATGLVSWSVILVTHLFHHAVTGTLLAWSLTLFAGFEIMAIRAGWHAMPTREGRWALVASSWPLVVLAGAVVFQTLRSLA